MLDWKNSHTAAALQTLRKFSGYLSGTILAVSLSLNGASARVVDGIQFADSISVHGKKLILNGVGLRQKQVIILVDVYRAGLYLEEATQDFHQAMDSKQLKYIDLVFLRSVDAEAIINSWNEGYLKACGNRCEMLQAQLDHLNSLMTDVKKNQRIGFTFYPDRFVLSAQGKSETFEGESFSKIILATFIGEAPPSVDLRNGMLGVVK